MEQTEKVKHGILSFVGQSWLRDTFPDILHNIQTFYISRRKRVAVWMDRVLGGLWGGGGSGLHVLLHQVTMAVSRPST